MKKLNKQQLHQLLIIKLIGEKVDESTLLKTEAINSKDLEIFKSNGLVDTYKENRKTWLYIDPILGSQTILPVMGVIEALVNVNLTLK